jgi:hypothetical protein
MFTICNQCGKEINSLHHYFIYNKPLDDKTIGMVEICKECKNKMKRHRNVVRTKGRPIIID